MKILLGIVGVFFGFILFFFLFGIFVNLFKAMIKYTFKLLYLAFTKGFSIFSLLGNKSDTSFFYSRKPKPNSIQDKSLFLRTFGHMDKDLVHIFHDEVQSSLGSGNGVQIHTKEYLYTLNGMPSIDKPRYLIAETHGGAFYMVLPSPHLLTTQEYVYGIRIDFSERKMDKTINAPYYLKVDILDKEQGTFIHIPLTNIRYFFDIKNFYPFDEFYFLLLNKEKLGLITDLNQFVSYLMQTYSSEVGYLKEQAKSLREENAKQATNTMKQASENVISLSSKRMERIGKEAN